MTTTKPCIGYHGVQNTNICAEQGCFGESCLAIDQGFFNVELRNGKAEFLDFQRLMFHRHPCASLSLNSESVLIWESLGPPIALEEPQYDYTLLPWYKRIFRRNL